METYEDWKQGITPNTNYSAKIRSVRNVSNVRVIEVEGAMYRGAYLKGIFELENKLKNDDPVIAQPSGKRKVKVVCAWYGVKPPTTFPQLDITNAKYNIVENYSGEVADNIA
ncbi:MAG: hypothetical protein ACOZF2_19280 [Thermodesulfobacteriota bacterium]